MRRNQIGAEMIKGGASNQETLPRLLNGTSQQTAQYCGSEEIAVVGQTLKRNGLGFTPLQGEFVEFPIIASAHGNIFGNSAFSSLG